MHVRASLAPRESDRGHSGMRKKRQGSVSSHVQRLSLGGVAAVRGSPPRDPPRAAVHSQLATVVGSVKKNEKEDCPIPP